MQNSNSDINYDRGPYRLFITDGINQYGTSKKTQTTIVKSKSLKDSGEKITLIVEKANVFKF